MHNEKPERVLELCVATGTALLRSGAETSRVEETICRIAEACGFTVAQGFATPTGLFISVGVGDDVATRLCRIYGNDSVDLNKVTELNELSRAFERGLCTIDEALQSVESITTSKHGYTPSIQLIAAGIASGCFAFLFQATVWDAVCAAIAGVVAFLVYNFAERRVPQFVAVFVASLSGAAVVAIAASLIPTIHLDQSIIGAMFPLVPGLAVTNSIRDMMAGDLLAGVARAADAFLTAMALAAAIVIVLTIIHR